MSKAAPQNQAVSDLFDIPADTESSSSAVHDLHFGSAHETFFTVREPFELAQRFPPPKLKKKKS